MCSYDISVSLGNVHPEVGLGTCFCLLRLNEAWYLESSNMILIKMIYSSRISYSGMAHYRHLKTVRTHLASLVLPYSSLKEPPPNVDDGVTPRIWQELKNFGLVRQAFMYSPLEKIDLVKRTFSDNCCEVRLNCPCDSTGQKIGIK